MTGMALLEAMSYVEDRHVAEAETAVVKSQRISYRWMAVAACLALVLFLRWQGIPEKATEGIEYQKENAAGALVEGEAPGEWEDACEEAGPESALDMPRFFLYDRRQYDLVETLETGSIETGKYIGTADGQVNEATKDYKEFSGSAQGPIYEIAGKDPEQWLCIVTDHGIELYQWAEKEEIP